MKAMIKDGGPAFPNFQFTENGKVEICPQGGMSLRDYFAAQIINGLLINSDTNVRGVIKDIYSRIDLVKCCYVIADAMLTARKESNT
jgi:hypothetical protein